MINTRLPFDDRTVRLSFLELYEFVPGCRKSDTCYHILKERDSGSDSQQNPTSSHACRSPNPFSDARVRVAPELGT